MMKVTVKLLGALGDLAGEDAMVPHVFTVPPEATARDLIVRLAERFGGPFDDPTGQDDKGAPAELPSRVHVFVNGELARKSDRPLAAPDTQSASVQVLIMKPVTGG